MERLEKVEKIREKTGVSYDDATKALNACNDDILDAIVYLEALGKVQGPMNTSYTTGPDYRNSLNFEKTQQAYNKDCTKSSVGSQIDKFVAWAKKVLKKSWETKFCVDHADKEVIKLPVLILVLLCLSAFWITVPLIVIGLFFDYRYHVDGSSKINFDINDVCDKASEKATQLKNDFKADKANSANQMNSNDNSNM